jgi:nitrate reductase beta subunit
VIPTAHRENAHALEELATDCPVGGTGSGVFGTGSGGPVPVAIQTLRETKERMQADDMSQVPGSVSYLAWDGRGMPGKPTPDDIASRPGIPGASGSSGAPARAAAPGGVRADEAGGTGVVDPRPDQGVPR